MGAIEEFEREQLRQDLPAFKSGDTVRVHFKVVEGTRERIQVFQGFCIAKQGHGARETFTVRKQSFGVGVERTFPLHSPKIEKIEVTAVGDVARAKKVYEGTRPLTAEDIADILVWVASRPAHVNIDELLVKPVDQAAVHKVYRRIT